MDSNPVPDSIGHVPSKELKRRARDTLTSRYTVPMTAYVLSQMIVMLISLPFESALQNHPSVFQLVTSGLAMFIILLLSNVLTGGLVYIHLNLTHGKAAVLTDVLRYFSRSPERFVLSDLLFTGISLLPMLPAIAITIIAVLRNTTILYTITAIAWIITLIPMFSITLRYALTNYLLVEEPEAGITDVFCKSRRLMEGHKMELFFLSLSFIGMYLLSILSVGIGFLWVIPYRNQTLAEFYRNIRKET